MLYLLVFLSGIAALVYEVVWSRQLSTFLGITTYAHTVVLASFMGGLAIGAWWFGRRADSARDPLLLFARLEAGIGCLGLLTLASTPALQSLYVTVAPENPSGWSAHAARLAMACLAVLPATILMGGTLPALVRGVQRRGHALGRTVASIYSVNTLGAAAGALASGYLLLPTLGIRGSLIGAATLNFTAAVGIVLWRGRVRHGADSAVAELPALVEPPLVEASRWVLLVAFGSSGAAALALQLGWIRALTQVLGSSVYAFGLTSASYLVGLALGSAVASLGAAALARRQLTLKTAAALEAAVALTVIAGLPVLGKLPEVFLTGYRLGVHESFPRLQVFAFLLASAVLIVPTTFLGALYPLVASRFPRTGKETGRGLGTAFGVNAFGTVLGTLLTGLALLPLLGADGLLRGASILSLAVAALILIADRGSAPGRLLLGSAAAVAAFFVLTLLVPRWDPTLMTSGPFINAARFVDVPPGEELRSWLRRRSRILYYEEGVEASVSVRDVGDERLLVINGKTDGSRYGDRRTQLTLAHLPLLSHRNPRKVLLIGLGTGMSAAAAAAHPDVNELAVVEISEEVIEASSYFSQENESVLDDSRLRLIRADARNFLLTSRASFDVILSEPSNPWITGVANLFTREFFALARGSLSPGGLMTQWFQTYGMSERDLRSVLRSFADVFPHVSVWSPQLGDLLLIGSLEPQSLSMNRLRALAATPRGRSQLESIELLEAADVARLFLLDDSGVRSFVEGARPNTDDLPQVEFNAPRSLYSETTLDNLTAVIDHLDGRALTAPLADVGAPGITSSGDRSFEAIGLVIELPRGTAARVEWRVSWTALVADRQDIPNPVGVGNRPVILLETPLYDLEIERSLEDGPLGPHQLKMRLEERLEGPTLETGAAAIASGESAFWMSRGPPAQASRALAWSCGAAGKRFPRYILTAAATSSIGPQDLERLAARIRCKRPAVIGSEEENE